jgi:MFS family permease
MSVQIEDFRKRPKRYENIDGTSEMFFGCMWLGFALYSAVSPLLPSRPAWLMLLWMNGTVLSGIGLGMWAAKTIKDRITYRRTGYVAYRCEKKRTALVMALAMIVSAVLAAALVLLLRWGLRHNAVSLTRLGMLSVAVATYACMVTFMSPEHRWKLWLAALMALFSVGVSFGGWEREIFNGISTLFFGLVWLASGLITLFLYIRRTRPAEQAE